MIKYFYLYENNMKNSKKRFERIRDNCISIVWLDHWNISYKLPTEMNDEQVDAKVVSRKYKYFSAEIHFKDSLIKKTHKEDSLALLILHELCHIYCWSWCQLFDDVFENWIDLSHNTNVYIHDYMMIIEEQMTETLARKFLEIYQAENKSNK